MLVAEFNIYGVYVPAFMVLMVLAYFSNLVLRRALEAVGFYRLVWHRSLVDLSLYVLLLGGLFFLFQEVTA